MSIALVPSAQRSAAPVALVHTRPDHDQVLRDTRRAMELAGWQDFVTPGSDVAIKPNLGWDKLLPGAISAPWVVEGVILTLRDHVGELFMVESDQVVMDVEKSLRLTGLGELCRRHGVTWCNMSAGRSVKVADSDRLVLRDVNIPEVLTRTDLITLPLLKTHNKTTITGALKNQWGCLETLRHNFHLVLTDAIADVNCSPDSRSWTGPLPSRATDPSRACQRRWTWSWRRATWSAWTGWRHG